MKVVFVALISCLACLALGENDQQRHIRQRQTQQWQEPGARPLPMVVGDKLSTMIDESENSKISPQVNEDGSRMKYEVMFRKGASYTTAHFKDFNLGQDCTMLVSGQNLPDGRSQAYKMAGKGKMELGTFWTQHVKGDTMNIEIHCPPNTLAKDTMHFEIDEVAVGFVDDETDPFSESVCGTFDFQNAICYSGTTRYTEARAVARLLVNGGSLCTGWLVNSGGWLITNEHCINSAAVAANTDYEFGAEAPACGTANCQLCHAGTVISGANYIKDSQALDYCLVQFTATSPQLTYGFLEIDNRDAVLNEQIYVPQHPSGRAKEFGIVSTHDLNPLGFCKVDSTTEVGCTGTQSEIGYFCDTEGGSSGSPVLATSSDKVIALHHCRGSSACTQSGGDPNRAVPIPLIMAEIGSIIDPTPTPPPVPTIPTPPPTPAPTSAPTPIPSISCSSTEDLFTLDYISDRFGAETTWTLVNNCNGATILSNGPYPNGAVTQCIESYCIPSGQQYTFTIFDSFGDGLCCAYGGGSYRNYLDSTLLGSGATFTSSQRNSFGACTGAPAPTPTSGTPAPTVAAPTSPSSFPCFSEVAAVPVQNQGPVKMPELLAGDKVLTANGYQTLYAFVHQDSQTTAEFLQFHTKEHPTPLEITSQHLLFVVGKPHAVPARSIQPGDLLQSSRWPNGVIVNAVTSVWRHGIYAPLTKDGTLAVDGIVSSCYVALQNNAGEYVELNGGISTGLSQHFVSHLAMSPVRLACIGISTSLCNSYDHKGFAHFAKVGLAFAEFADSQSLPVQGMLLAAYLLVFGFLFLLEFLLGCRLALLAVIGVVVSASQRLFSTMNKPKPAHKEKEC